jgi:transcriptional regulator GlxA family with amidase domain
MALAVGIDSLVKDAARQYLHKPYRKETTRQTLPVTGPENTESP